MINNGMVGSVSVVESMKGKYRLGSSPAAYVSPPNNTGRCVGLSDMNIKTFTKFLNGFSHKKGHVANMMMIVKNPYWRIDGKNVLNH